MIMANKASKVLKQIAEETGAELQECDRCGKKTYIILVSSDGMEEICESCEKKERKHERREPFTVGQYVFVACELDTESTFGVITRNRGRHRYIILTEQGIELTADDEAMCDANPGDISWRDYCIPGGSCLVNLEPEDRFYTSDPRLGVNFSPFDKDTDTLNHVLREALTAKFPGVQFEVTPLMDDEEERFTLHNNSGASDDEINAFVNAFLDKVSEIPEIWNIDEDGDEVDE
jgi:hypothetical protein